MNKMITENVKMMTKNIDYIFDLILTINNLYGIQLLFIFFSCVIYIVKALNVAIEFGVIYERGVDDKYRFTMLSVNIGSSVLFLVLRKSVLSRWYCIILLFSCSRL